MTVAKAIGSQQFVVLMLGVPGSGKSFFARQLAEAAGWARLNRVSLRKELFGRRACLKLPANEERLKEVLNGRLKSLVASGQSVICDYQHNLRVQRTQTARLVCQAGATVVSVWIQTPPRVAFARGVGRESSPDSVRIPSHRMEKTINRNLDVFEAPQPSEKVVEIDGLWPFDHQLTVFTARLGLVSRV